MEETVKNIRNDIIQKFCRTIVWIDDDIHLNTGLVTSLFWEKYKEFTVQGLVCHLMEFPAVRSEVDPYPDTTEVEKIIESCIKLTHQSDIVIVDWMLGSTDSSAFAIKIINSLLGKKQGFRFIVILTQVDLNDENITNLDNSFSPLGQDGDLWKNANGQFLLSLKKSDFETTHLFNRISSALFMAYPDYLHLAALEITGRIKEFTPQWLANIPSNTDLGVLVERANTFTEDQITWRNELQNCITSNLLEDLSTIILHNDLTSFNNNLLMPTNSLPKITIPQVDSIKDTFSCLNKCLDNDKPQGLSSKVYKKILKEKSNPEISQLINSIESFTEFCEVKSGEYSDYPVCPGAIFPYKSNIVCPADPFDADNSIAPQAIAVCISGGCDCLRSQTLLFLIGVGLVDKEDPEESKTWIEVIEDKKLKGGKSILRFRGQAYVFSSQPSSLFWKRREELNSIYPIGILRNDIVNRLTSRFMTHIRRVGVNQPSISRSLRGEGGFDE